MNACIDGTTIYSNILHMGNGQTDIFRQEKWRDLKFTVYNYTTTITTTTSTVLKLTRKMVIRRNKALS